MPVKHRFKPTFLFLTIITVFAHTALLNAQETTTLSGKIKDTVNTPLPGANILLMPKTKGDSPVFSVSDENGAFKTDVKVGILYQLTITYIGFETINTPIIFNNEEVYQEYTLKPSKNELEEVVINYTPPISIKKDTTTYRVDAFTDGKERKLREVLKKLPGVEVNRDGEVFFKNQKVTKVLVEDKTFFDGKTKIATENIPADVINEIQMIEDYQETGFLKGFKDSEELVMNIKLKEGKKNFVFGTIETGVGVDDRYKLNPSIFKYNPKYLFNLIGDANNTFSKSFTLSDYLQFEGETSLENITNNLNSTVAKFLRNNDYFDSKHRFLGFNGQYNPNDSNEVRLFAIGLWDRSFFGSTNTIIYQPSLTLEERVFSNTKNNNIFLAKLYYKYTPDKNTVIKLSTSVENIGLDDINKNSTLSPGLGDTLEYTNNNFLETLKITSNASVDKWFSDKNVSSINLSYQLNNEKLNNLYQSRENIFSPQIPLLIDSEYLVNGKNLRKNHSLNFNLTHYYRPTRIGLFTFELEGYINARDFDFKDFQIVNNGNINLFEGFNNNVSSTLNNVLSSVNYKRLLGKLSISAGLGYQYTTWKDKYILNAFISEHSRIIPSVKIEIPLSETKTIKLTYNQTAGNPDLYSRLQNQKIEDFNRVFIGNPELDQYVNNRLFITYSSRALYGWSIYSNLGFRKINRQIVYANTINGIFGQVAPVQLTPANKGLDFLFRIKHNKRYWNISTTNSFYYNELLTLLNNNISKNISRSYNTILFFQTNYENLPNVELEVKKSFFFNGNNVFKNNTSVTDLDFSLNYQIGDWRLDSSFLQTYYRNKSQSVIADFGQLNGTVLYNKEDSAWEFGVHFFNLANNNSKTTNSFNVNRFNESNILVFPRTVMLNINYRL